MIAFRHAAVAVLVGASTLAFCQSTVPGYHTSFDGTKIYYEVAGQGYPVVLVHGFTGTGESWKRGALYADLLSAGYKVVTLDLRGNGKSDKPHDCEAYANDAEAKDIMGLLASLKIKNYYAVGYSRGAIIVSRLLVLDKHAKKIIMGGIGAEFTDPGWPRRIMFYKALAGIEPAKELEGLMRRIQDEGLDQQAFACQQKYQPSTSKEQLVKVKKPVLIICGDKDQDNGSGKELTRLIPDAIFKEVPGDHNGSARTKEFSGEVILFLRSNS